MDAIPPLMTQNSLLARLRPDDAGLILPHLRRIENEANTILYDPGENVQTVYFPCGEAMVSFMVLVDDGDSIETMIVGREGAVGGIVSHGRLPAYTRIMVQRGGQFLALPVKVLDEAKARSRALDSLFARYADCLMAQIFQATACNASHSIERRAAKWIIASAERMETDEVAMTQERLSAMLGVGRSYVSRIIRTLKDDGLLSVRRGRMVIHDHEGLKARACTCNEAVKSHFNAVLEGVYPGAD